MSAHPELATLTLAEAARRIAARELSPVELTRATIERIEALNGHLAAFITVPAELAERQAADAEREIAASGPRSPLHGIPVALKDNIATAGVETTAASEVLRGWVPEEDATCWARQREAGAVLAGKTLLHEFAIAGSLWSAGFGAARNPWDLTRSTNGSSSGSAAAVAAGLAFAALGTETGASVRRPAAFCGLVGLLGSFGRVSRRGVIVNSWSLDHVGPLTRSVEDAAIVLEAISGADSGDPSSFGEPLRGLREACVRGAEGLRGLRVGVSWRHAEGSVDDAVLALVRAAVGALEDAGATVVELELGRTEYAAACSSAIMRAEATAAHAARLDGGARYSTQLAARLVGDRAIPAHDYLLAQRARRAIGEEIGRAFEQVDVIAAPTTATAATPLDGGFGVMRDRPLEVGPQWHNLHRVSSLLGLPAITLPCGRVPAEGAASGLPVGLQLIGRRFEEATLLRAAAGAEALAPPWQPPPLDPAVPPPPYPPGMEQQGGQGSLSIEPLREAVLRLRELDLDGFEGDPAFSFRPELEGRPRPEARR